VAEIARLAVVFAVPVIGELHLRRRPALARGHQGLVLGRSEKDQREAAFLLGDASGLLQAELVAIEVERLVEIAHAQHGVEITHRFLVEWDKL
jgi:hypothetical protein